MTADVVHRHGHRVHSHPHTGTHRHLALLLRPSEPLAETHDHGHSHGLIDPSIVRSRSGIRAVSWSLAILTLTAFAQAFIYKQTLSVALLADLIHNFGDALTAIPLGVAFFLRSARGERWAGLAVVLAIFISALVALGQTIERFIHPRTLSHLWLLAAAGLIGFIGNEIAAQVRLRAGRRLQSPALDGRRQPRPRRRLRLARRASRAPPSSASGVPIADPIIGLVITLVILQGSPGTPGGGCEAPATTIEGAHLRARRRAEREGHLDPGLRRVRRALAADRP